ncbi:MAG: DUF2299 family protein [Candidatus Marinimicrobia bacterium]|nr:DUF2299 family protein [Candidatus Neomarinimicrobiota bacterium]
MIDKATILDWFSAECDTPPSEGESDDAIWVLVGILGKITMNIVQPKDASHIQIQRGIELQDQHKSVIRGRTKKMQAEFLYRLKLGLIQTQVRWKFVFSDPGQAEFAGVHMFTRIFEDGLSRDTFVDRLMKVHDASILVLVELNKITEE